MREGEMTEFLWEDKRDFGLWQTELRGAAEAEDRLISDKKKQKPK